MAKKGWTIGKTRSALYKTARILGDINAVNRGSIGQRAINRTVGKVSGRVTGKVSRSIWKIFK